MTPLFALMSHVIAALPVPSPAPTASVSIVAPPPVDKTGVGGLGFLIVMALLAASVGLFFAMRGSLRRLQQRDLDGSFGKPTAAGTDPTPR